jgi:tetratricopeptide (TPR) repeat protein
MGGIMSKHAFAVLFVVLLFSWPGTAAAQSDELMRAYQQFQALYKQGRYGEAERFARKALELGEQEFGPEHPEVAALLIHLAELYRAQGRYAAAEPLYKRSLAIWEKALGPEHPDVASSLNNLAELYRVQGRYAAAEPLYKRTLAIKEKALGPEHPDVATSRENYAKLLENLPIAASYAGLDFGRYFALVIGNDNYQSLPRLETAVADAQAVTRVLERSYGFETTVLTNATRAGILDALDGLRRRLRDDDNLLIYYAGHGWLDRDAGRGYWQPVDADEDRRANWLSNADITDTLKAVQARHVMVVADSCYSGTMTRTASRGVSVTARPPGYIARLARLRSRTVLSSGGLEPVADRGSGGHSVFAKALLDVLRDNAALIDGTDLFAKVRQQVRLNAEQTPQYQNIRMAGHEVGGDFLFVRRR